MEPLQFVNVTRCEVSRSKNTHALGVSEEDRRRIRIQVQRDFRRKEKQRLSNATSPASTASSLDSRSTKKSHNEELFSVIGPPSQIPSTINAPDLWLDSLAHAMIEDCYPRENGSMHVLENNVAYSYHMKCDTPMRAIREALSCLHVGSTLGHQSALHEGMKRYVCAINCLREDAALRKPKMTVSGLAMVGMGILLCQKYAAVSGGSSSNTWQSHITGISALLSANQLDNADTAHTAFGSFLVQQIGVVQLVHSLCTRKPFSGGLPVRAMSTRSAKVNFLLDLAFRVPPLLEEIDLATNTESPKPDCISSLISNILALKKTFESWLQSFSTISRPDQEDPSSALTPKPSIHDLTCESLCRICLLLLVSGLSDLEKKTRNNNNPPRHPTFAPASYAIELRKTASLFTSATKIPVVKARGVSGPLHFLDGYYSKVGDSEGKKWCLDLKESVCREAPYLSWDVMLPWSLLTLYAIPLRTTEVEVGGERRALI